MKWFPGNYAIRIAADTEPSIVTAGAAEVFVADRASGERWHVFSIDTGGPLLPLPIPPDARWEIVAVTLEPTCVSSEELEPEWAAIIALDNWLSIIGDAFGRLRPANGLLSIEPGGLLLQAGQRICIKEGLNFVRLNAGDGSLCGTPIKTGKTVALVPGLWLEAVSPEVESDWEVLNNADASMASSFHELRATLDLVVPLFLDALCEAQENRTREESARLGRKRDAERELTARAVDLLALPSEHKRRTIGDPLADAVNAVLGKALSNVRPGFHHVRDIAESCGIRSRRVHLDENWWRQDSGRLLGEWENGAPIALLPTNDGYEAFDPSTRARTIINAEVARLLKPYAYVLHDPPPDGLTVGKCVRFLMEFRLNDLRTWMVASLGAAVLSAAIPVGTSLLIGIAIPDSDRSMIRAVGLAMAVAAIGAVLLRIVESTAIMRVQISLLQRLQTAAWDHILRLSPTFFRLFTVGGLRLRADGYTRIHQLLPADSVRSLFGILGALFSLAVVFWYSAAVGWIALFCGAITVMMAWMAYRAILPLHDSSLRTEEFLSGFGLQAIRGAMKLRIAGAANRSFFQWADHYSRQQMIGMQIREMRDRVRLGNVILPQLGLTLSFLWYADHEVTVGAFMAAQAALLAFLLALSSAADTWVAVLPVAALWKRSNSILETSPETKPAVTHPGRLRGAVSVDAVTFRYRESGQPVLDQISLQAAPGECIAITGPSGSGKSTLLNLLLRFDVPQSGSISLDGRELSSLDISAVRRQIGVVTQDGRLLADSIFSNITCGGLYTMDEAWEAARAAALADDIKEMPMGMHTIVSDGGLNISGGQRQRILISRALILKPSILIFDEATSTLDNHTQAVVSESLRKLSATRILVAHRLSTIRTADRIYVMEKGRIVQQGTYDQLSQVPGLFARLTQRQVANVDRI